MMCDGFRLRTRSSETWWNGSMRISSPGISLPRTARTSRGLAPWPSMVLSIREINKLFQTVKLPVESPDVNSPVQDRGCCVDIITDLQLANRVAIFSRHRVKPARLVAKHHASVNDRRRPPDRSLRAIPPNNFAFVSGQAVEVTVARADVNSTIRHDRARPDSVLPQSIRVFGFKLPNKLAVVLPKAINETILSRCINFAFVNCWSRIGVGADAGFPNYFAVAEIQTEEIALLCADVNATINN